MKGRGQEARPGVGVEPPLRGRSPAGRRLLGPQRGGLHLQQRQGGRTEGGLGGGGIKGGVGGGGIKGGLGGGGI